MRCFMIPCVLFMFVGGANAQETLKVPSEEGQLMLIRNALTALNHAGISGNFTVLRDLSSTPFQQRHKASDLAKLFDSIRAQRLDLSPVLVSSPVLVRPVVVDQASRRLLFVGYFPTQPRVLHFEIIYVYEQGGWMIDDLTVGVEPIHPQANNPVGRVSLASAESQSSGER